MRLYLVLTSIWLRPGSLNDVKSNDEVKKHVDKLIRHGLKIKTSWVQFPLLDTDDVYKCRANF